MIKRLLSLFLIFLLLFLSACDENVIPPVGDDKNEEKTGTEDEYLAITPVKVGMLTPYTLALDGIAISAPLPKSWEFEEENGTYTIRKGGLVIGKAYSGYSSDTNWRAVHEDICDMENGILLHTVIEKSVEGVEAKFRYRLHFTTREKEYLAATIVVDYRELDESTFSAFLRDAGMHPQVNPSIHGLLLDFSECGSVLLLGNSFISTSRIGTILTKILDDSQSGITVTAISRGYAHVGTYTQDASIMQAIRTGTYGAVFISGLYSDSEVENLRLLKAACDTSDTPLVVFPAHNESASAINKAKREVDGVYFLSWRDEINALIDSHVDYFAMCINDQHKHSTPLAGYVGAHMIYRALFDESPDPIEISGLLTCETLEAALGSSYLQTGMVADGNVLIFP